MRHLKFAVSAAALLMLAGCVDYPNQTHDDLSNWWRGRPSAFDRALGTWPTGYARQNAPDRFAANIDQPVVTYPIEETAQPILAMPEPRMPMQIDRSFNEGNPLDQVYFDHGSTRINNSEKKGLRSSASKIKKEGKDVDVTVVGHASTRVDENVDPVRRKEINFEMAQKRAEAVKGQLRKDGVRPASVTSISKGDDDANPNPDSRSEERQDRRVDVYMNDR